MIQFRGIEFRSVDNRLMALKLVQLGLSGVAMFGPDRRGAAAERGAAQEGDPGRAGQLPPADASSTSTCSSAAQAKFEADPAVAGGEVLRAHRDHDGATCWPAAATSTGATSWPGPTCSRPAA